MMSKHQRNTGPMMSSLRCGAKTRGGGACKSPAVSGKQRCRMHGGAKGSGAPLGNSNAWKHGYYSRAELEEDRKVREMINQMNAAEGGRSQHDAENQLQQIALDLLLKTQK
jgi:uncharacterized protein YjcR